MNVGFFIILISRQTITSCTSRVIILLVCIVTRNLSVKKTANPQKIELHFRHRCTSRASRPILFLGPRDDVVNSEEEDCSFDSSFVSLKLDCQRFENAQIFHILKFASEAIDAPGRFVSFCMFGPQGGQSSDGVGSTVLSQCPWNDF